jgi:uncharacterized LabA/DUF88 family protein
MKDSKIKTYQKFLESTEAIKDDFLFQIRQENRSTQDERIGLFVDIQNIYYSSKSLGGKIDFKKLLENTVRNRHLITAKTYLVNSDVDNSQFVKLLKQLKYDIVSKSLKTRADGSQKANLDIEMTIDIMEAKNGLDTVAIVTGDGDFVPLVEFLKLQSISVEIYGVLTTTAVDLKNAASRFFEIDSSYLYFGDK